MKKPKVGKWLKKTLAGGGRVTARSNAFHRLVPRSAKIERIATGFLFTEGPVYLPGEACLLFSDIPGNRIYRIGEDGVCDVWRSPSHNANGLTLDREGRLIVCEHGARRVTRTEGDGNITVLADRFEGKKLNSPNDVIVRSDGAVYFTDPPYGIEAGEQEQSVQGVYRIPPEGGEPALVADDFERPNGLAFSPDERFLYVDDSAPDKRHVRVFAVTGEGGLAEGRLFADLNCGGRGTTDGMKVDREGHLFCTGPGGIWVFCPRGNHLGTIVLPEQPSNCAWGGADLSTLYVTAESSVYRVRTATSGPPPSGAPGSEGGAP